MRDYAKIVEKMREARWPARTISERFWAKVNKPTTDGCWTWTGSLNSDGYGSFCVEHNRTQKAHRMAWELEHGPVPKGFCVCHKCDNPACVNPSHLFLGTHAENMKDMAAKGRTNTGPALTTLRARRSAKTHCRRGHAFAGANLRNLKGPPGAIWRGCRECKQITNHRAYLRRLARRKDISARFA
jgi:HNH endonuclease